MKKRSSRLRSALVRTAAPAGLFCLLGQAGHAASGLSPIPRFPLPSSPIAIVRNTEVAKPFSVAGENGAFFGFQNGECEAWIFPLKVLYGLHVTAELDGYPVPIDVNAQPGSVEVNPWRTTITYSHAAFTLKQHMISMRGQTGVPGTGPVILFEISSIRPMQLTVRFTPSVERMWPAPNFGRPNAEWVEKGDSSYYVLHTDNDKVSAAIALPRAKAGTLAPYQERPKTYPVEFRLRFDPTKDSDLFFPLLMAAGSGSQALGAQLSSLNAAVPEAYRETQRHYEELLGSSLRVESPDATFNQALQWAIVSIDQAQVRHNDETGLVAGYYSAGDSARPGFGWFFGRDTLWTLYAVNAYGDAAFSRRALDFLLHRQRSDGKIMHEYSQTAELVPWNDLPYFYASADSTPLLLMVMEDYVTTSGDVAYLKQHWEGLKLAYAFVRAHDSDGDGIYENTEGTGWVESWPSGMPHQEIYLAALDQQGTESMSRLARLMNDTDLVDSAAEHAAVIRGQLTSGYLDAAKHFYAFSRNADGSLDKTETIYPAVAWWTGRLALPHAQGMFSSWASHDFSTDWGTRDVSGEEKIFDPISYHQGSVWPLFTGWASLAEFRGGRPLSATAHLMQNLLLTYQQDLGAVTELLSGAYFQPMGRSSSHQLWSSAMVLSPALRGLLGLDFDALHHTLRLSPHLPASWDHVRLHQVPLGDLRLDVEMLREKGELVVRATSPAAATFCLAAQTATSEDCKHTPRTIEEMRLPLPAVEVEPSYALPVPGAATEQLKVLDEQHSPNRLTLELEAMGGTTLAFKLRRNGSASIRVTGATVGENQMSVPFRAGAGYQRKTVVLEW
ncbi:MAG: glycogen debranching protein [Bryobacteraceae bacterium]